MFESDDVWYVRLPTGKVLRANGTQSVRDSLRAGHLPVTCEVRRSPEAEWVGLEWVEDFADLARRRAANGASGIRKRRPHPAPPPRTVNLEAGSVSARLDPDRLPSSGVARMLRELLTPLDRALVGDRLAVGVGLGLVGGVIAAVAESDWLAPLGAAPWMVWAVAGPLLLMLAAVAAGLLTQGAYAEVTRMRPAQWGESTRGLGALAVRTFFGLLLVGGGAVLAVWGLRWLVVWFAGQEGLGWPVGLHEAVADGLAVTAFLVEVVLWAVLVLALLLPAVMVAEECGLVRGLGRWLALLRRYGLRVWLYEALALGLGLLVVAAAALPLALAGGGAIGPAVAFLMRVLVGVAAGVVFGYLMVANVFIYLNLRYATVEEPTAHVER